jgi:hypothetical protein
MDPWSRKEIVDAAYVCTVGHCRSQRWRSRLPGLLGIPPVIRHPRWLLAQRNARTPLPPLYTADELWSLLGPSAREALAGRIKTGNLETDFDHWATSAPSLLDRPLTFRTGSLAGSTCSSSSLRNRATSSPRSTIQNSSTSSPQPSSAASSLRQCAGAPHNDRSTLLSLVSRRSCLKPAKASWSVWAEKTQA